jgi:predicted kinase
VNDAKQSLQSVLQVLVAPLAERLVVDHGWQYPLNEQRAHSAKGWRGVLGLGSADVADLIHLNGPPGVGKSTIARRFVAEHPGVLNCDIDVLRTLVGGWSEDFGMAGALIRPAALAMMEAYLTDGHDVVLPQLIASPAELARIEECARSANARLVHRFLMADVEQAVARFNRRGQREPDDPWHAQVRAIVAGEGGDEVLIRYHSALEHLIAERPGAVVIQTSEGAVDETYQQLIDSFV